MNIVIICLFENSYLVINMKIVILCKLVLSSNIIYYIAKYYDRR